MIRILRSLIQEPNDPELSSNMVEVLSFQLEFDKKVEEDIYGVIRYFSHNNGGQPSLSYVRDKVVKQHGQNSAHAALVDDLARFDPELGATFRARLKEYTDDKVLGGLKSGISLVVSKLDALQAKPDISTAELIDQFSAEASRVILDAREKVTESKVDTQGELTSPEVYKKHMDKIREDMKQGIKAGLFTGYPDIDQHTFGFHNGELILIAGFTGELKSTTCRNMFYNMLKLGANLLYITCEITYERTVDQFVVLHSNHEKWGRPPLDYTKVKNRIMTGEEFEFMNLVFKDLTESPDLGRLFIVQPRDRAFRWSEVVTMMNSYDSQAQLDAVCLDYYDWVVWDGQKARDETEVNEMIKASKVLAQTFRGGEGIVFVSPFQINNEGYAWAQQHDGIYHLNHLSTHNQSRRAADFVISSYLGPEGSKLRDAQQVKLGCLKNRDGDPFAPLILQTSLKSGIVYPTSILTGGTDQAGDADIIRIPQSEIASQALVSALDDL